MAFTFYEAERFDLSLFTGDTVASVSPFVATARMQGSPQLQLPLQPLQGAASLQCSGIFIGYTLDCPPFVAAGRISGSPPLHQLSCPP